jgi:hypothetical protein
MSEKIPQEAASLADIDNNTDLADDDSDVGTFFMGFAAGEGGAANLCPLQRLMAAAQAGEQVGESPDHTE